MAFVTKVVTRETRADIGRGGMDNELKELALVKALNESLKELLNESYLTRSQAQQIFSVGFSVSQTHHHYHYHYSLDKSLKIYDHLNIT